MATKIPAVIGAGGRPSQLQSADSLALGTPASGVLTNATGYQASALAGSKVSAYLASDQSLGSGAWVTIQLDTEVTDTLGEYNPATYTFTPAETGTYLIDWKLTISTTGRVLASIWTGTASELKRVWEVESGQISNCISLVELTAATGYTFRAFPFTSLTAQGGAGKTNIVIRRMY